MIFPRWLHLRHISDGFEILFALCWPPPPCSSRLSESHNFQANNSDDGGDRDRAKTPVTQSSRFGFLNLNYSEITVYFKMPFWLLVDNKYIYIMPERQFPAPPTNSQTEAPPDSTCPCPNMSNMCKHDTW